MRQAFGALDRAMAAAAEGRQGEGGAAERESRMARESIFPGSEDQSGFTVNVLSSTERITDSGRFMQPLGLLFTPSRLLPPPPDTPQTPHSYTPSVPSTFLPLPLPSVSLFLGLLLRKPTPGMVYLLVL